MPFTKYISVLFVRYDFNSLRLVFLSHTDQVSPIISRGLVSNAFCKSRTAILKKPRSINEPFICAV